VSSDDEVHVHLFADGATLSVHISGEVDVLSAPQLQDRLVLPERLAVLHLDLSGVVFLDVRGAAAVEAAVRRAKDLGAVVEVSGQSRAQRKLLGLLGMDDIFVAGEAHG
jgi:anti-sigma B factor antagonist